MNRFLLSTLVLFAACGPDSMSSVAGEEAGASLSTHASALGGVSSVSFRRDWSVVSTGALVVGTQLKLDYDTERLSGCRLERDNQPLWTITGFWRLAGREGTFWAGGHSPDGVTTQPVLPLEAQGELELWFQVTSAAGCMAWDSNYGHNYRFAVQRPGPTVRFLTDWRQEQTSDTRGARNVVFEYEPARLPRCRAGYAGFATWDILLWYRFDGGAVSYFPTTRGEGRERVMNPVVLPVPAGARELEVWFRSGDRAGCSEWDSRFGANYRFAL